MTPLPEGLRERVARRLFAVAQGHNFDAMSPLDRAGWMNLADEAIRFAEWARRGPLPPKKGEGGAEPCACGKYQLESWCGTYSDHEGTHRRDECLDDKKGVLTSSPLTYPPDEFLP